MARQPATRLQRSGYRFLLRRTAHALVRGDARMLDDPLRSQAVSFIAGCVLAAVAVVAGFVLALVRPGSAVGSAPILISPRTGALYVNVDGLVRPALNLASARLVTGSSADPQPVSDTALGKARRGAAIGIPGAPHRIDRPLTSDESGWTLCDVGEPAGTVLVVGRPRTALRPFRDGAALLVAARDEGAAITYLLFDGRRARVDLRDIAVVRALRMEGVAPTPVSRALLDSVPEAPGVAAPVVPAVGATGPHALGGLTVGTVVRAGVGEFYVVLAGGLQRVGQVAADLIRFTVAQPGGEPPEITADTVAKVPIVSNLGVGLLPRHMRVGKSAVLCAGWDASRPAAGSKTTLYDADSISDPMTELVQHDGAGPALDQVAVPAGRSAVVRATGLSADAAVSGPMYLIDDLGVRFGLHDDDAVTRLGLALPVLPGPWPMLALLPSGPELSRDAASAPRDGLGAVRVAP